MSASVPWLKYMVIEAVPVLVAVEVIYIMSSTPLSDSSSGTITLFITVSALAPVYVAVTRTVGGAIFGNCSIGKRARPRAPTMTMSTEITPARMGRSMKVFTVIAIIFCGKISH